MAKLKDILQKNFKSIVYTVKQAQECDRTLLPLMLLNMLVDAMVPFIAVVFPKYIIDELTIGKNFKNAVSLVVFFA